MFCVECGKDEPIFRNGVCLHCYLKTMQFSKGPTVIDITHCPRCAAYKQKNTWVQASFDDILKRQIKDAFTISPELNNVIIQTQCQEQDRILRCMVSISGSVEDQHITEQHPLTVRLRHSTCDICSREAGGYYEAILQIRTVQRTFSKEELKILHSTVETMVEQLQKNGKRGLFITDFEETRQGLDFFLSEKTTAFSIAKKIQEQFGGDFKQSASAAGMKDSKEIYRMTYLIRIPAYRKGDFFSYDNSFFMIVSLHEQKVRALELPTWQEKVMEGKNIQPSRIYGGAELVREMILISQTTQEIQLMDPKTYMTVEIHKPEPISIEPPLVKTVKLDDYLFLLPS